MFHPSAADHVHGRPIRSRDRLDAEAAEDDRNFGVFQTFHPEAGTDLGGMCSCPIGCSRLERIKWRIPDIPAIFFWPILHGRRRWHARPPQLFQRISGMRCSWGRPSVENIVTSSRNRSVLFLVVWNTCLLRAPVGVCGNRFHPHIAHWLAAAILKCSLHFFQWNVEPISPLQSHLYIEQVN